MPEPAGPEDILRAMNPALAATPAPVAVPPTEAFHEDHMRLLSAKLASKIDVLEAENGERQRVALAQRALAGTHFDPAVVTAFKQWMDEAL